MERDNNRYNNPKDKDSDLSGNINKGNGWEQYSNKLGNKFSNYGDEEAFLDEVNLSLAKQISMELEDNHTSTKETVKKKSKYKGLKIFAIVFSVLMLITAFLAFTPWGNKLVINLAGNYIYSKLEYQNPDNNPVVNSTDTQEQTKPTKPVEHIVNILLLGVEEIGGASNTDSMIIATMNTKDKTIKLTSIMRDLYVEIPGYNNNKLNSVFAKGGIDLLYQTIYNNFGIQLDGYAMVNFSAFEKIVDLLDGVEVTLTNHEAYYLNTTNYISDPANRNVVEGKQIMNGNQALGYCRVRKVSTGTENNDFGRTQRQRAVLNAIFDKLKTKNILELGLFMNDVLNDVKIKTDITQTEFNEYLNEAASLKVKELTQFRIPEDGSYDSQRVPMGSYNVEVLVPKDWEQTKSDIHDFIYGSTDIAESTTESSDEASSTEE
jgi:polyisoprenyl-teichoic acid--peptidoglycan teichoic acid transferase